MQCSFSFFVLISAFSSHYCFYSSATYSTENMAIATPNLTTILNPAEQHPYYPLTASIPGYAPNQNTVSYLLTTFFSACTLLLTATYLLASRANPSLTRSQLATVIWFILSGAIHIFFEGFYVAHFADLGASSTLR